MIKDRKIKNEEIFSKRIQDVEIHNIASINPMQSEEDFIALKYSIEQIGQQDPVVFFKGKLVDGRNRLKALNELYNNAPEGEKFKYENIKYKKLPTTLSMQELEEIVIGKEVRRHKTPTQKAIQAMTYYLRKTNEGVNINMAKAGKIFGASPAQISRAIECRKIAGDIVIQRLFNGEKIPIKKAKKDGTIYTVNSDSLDSISKYYKSMNGGGPNGKYNTTIDAIELAYIQIVVTELLSDLSYIGIKNLLEIVEANADNQKQSYNLDKMKDILDLSQSN